MREEEDWKLKTQRMDLKPIPSNLRKEDWKLKTQ